MRKMMIVAAFILAGTATAFGQEFFTGLGTKGIYNKPVKGAKTFYVPQLQIGFETYMETTQVVQEGKLSKLQNVFEANSKGGQYAGQQSGSAKVTTILNCNLELADFQELADDFQSILDSEIENSGLGVIKMSEIDKFPSFEKVKEKYGDKTDKKQGKTSDSDIGNATVKVTPKNTFFLFDEKSVMKGGGPAFYTMMKKVHSETNATMILQNINIDFTTVELDVQLDAGRKGKTTTAEMKVYPKMRISYNTFDFIGPNGGPNAAPASLTSEFVASRTYNAKIYSDKAKAESLFSKLFSLKGKPDVNFDPRIVEMSKEDYKAAAKELFTEYSREFAKTLASVANGGK